MQPLIAPLYEGRSAHEVLGAFTDAVGPPDARDRQGLLDPRVRRREWMDDIRDASGQAVHERRRVLEALGPRRVRARHRDRRRRSGDAVQARTEGAVTSRCGSCDRATSRRCGSRAANSCARGSHRRRQRSRHPRRPPRQGRHLASPPSIQRSNAQAIASDLEIIFRPDPTIWDGRFANIGWLQELPKPLTKITWDTTAWVHPGFAEEHGLRDGDVIELRYRGNVARMPVWRVPGQPRQSVTVFFGYGRRRAGRVGNASRGLPSSSTRSCSAHPTRRGSARASKSRRPVNATWWRRRRNIT